MNCIKTRRQIGGLSLVAVVAVIAAILILAMLLLSGLSQSRSRARRISCNCRLKQIGLAFRMWSNDHAEHFPWTVPQSNGGTFEFAMSTQVWRHFQVASNELNSPKILVCPADPARGLANSFVPPVSNVNISYFVGLDADETKPQTILSDDRNLSTNMSILSGIVTFQKVEMIRWAPGIHNEGGNIGLGDGSVQQALGSPMSQWPLPFRVSIP